MNDKVDNEFDTALLKKPTNIMTDDVEKDLNFFDIFSFQFTVLGERWKSLNWLLQIEMNRFTILVLEYRQF